MSEKGAGQKAWAVIAVLLVVAAGIVVYIRTREKPVEMPKHFKVAGVCLACRNEASLDIPAGQVQPYTCASCGKKAVYTWLYCSKCQKRFVPTLEPGEPPRPPREPVCPACGNKNVSTWYAETLPGQEHPSLPLPPWPVSTTSTAPAPQTAPAP